MVIKVIKYIVESLMLVVPALTRCQPLGDNRGRSFLDGIIFINTVCNFFRHVNNVPYNVPRSLIIQTAQIE